MLEDAEVTGDGGSPGPSRRALLAGAAASLPLLLTACKGVQALGTPPPPACDIRVLAAAIAAEEAMVARYAAALRQLTAAAGPAAPEGAPLAARPGRGPLRSPQWPPCVRSTWPTWPSSGRASSTRRR